MLHSATATAGAGRALNHCRNGAAPARLVGGRLSGRRWRRTSDPPCQCLQRLDEATEDPGPEQAADRHAGQQVQEQWRDHEARLRPHGGRHPDCSMQLCQLGAATSVGGGHELCPWSKLISVADCREEVAGRRARADIGIGWRPGPPLVAEERALNRAIDGTG